MPSDYLLASGDAEMQRLRLQAQVWEPAAIDFLATLDIQPGSKALDLGCGAMGIMRPLSRSVGDTGAVVGLDSDATQLAAARSFVEEAKLTNVSIIEGNAFDTGLPAGHFDLVHVRFLFAPVGRDLRAADRDASSPTPWRHNRHTGAGCLVLECCPHQLVVERPEDRNACGVSRRRRRFRRRMPHFWNASSRRCAADFPA